MPKKNSFLITGHSPCDPNRVRPSPSRRLRPRESGLWIHSLGLGNQKCARGTGRSAPSNRPLPSMRSGESEVAGFLNPAGEKAQTPVVIPVLCLSMIILAVFQSGCVFRRCRSLIPISWRSLFRVMPITVGAKRRWAVTGAVVVGRGVVVGVEGAAFEQIGRAHV